MSQQWEVLESIDDVDAGEWNAVVRGCGGSVFHTHQWLRAYEQAPPAPIHHVRHIVMRRGGELRLVAPMYESSEDPHYTGYGPDYGFDHPILWSRMLVGHSWYSYYNGVCSLDAAPEVAPALVDTMHQVAVSLGTPFYGFPGVPEADPLCAELARHGFASAYTEATSRTEIGGSLDDYLRRLRPKVRRELGRLARRHARLGATVRHDLRDGDVAAFATLVEEVCARHGVPSVNPPHSLASIFANLSEQVRFLSIWHGEVLLGGFVLLHFDDVLYAWIAGLNYDFHKEYGTYYALYWETLRLAHELGVRRLEMGRSMYGFKVKMGLHPQLLVSWFRAADAAGREVLASGLPVLHQACRTRERVAEAYRANGALAPDAA